MKDDYLWDKTGDDAEIEKFENSLQMFRYQETAPPIVAAKISVIQNNPRKTFVLFPQFRFALSSAFCFGLVVIIAIAAWFLVSSVDQSMIAATQIEPIQTRVIPNETLTILPKNEQILANPTEVSQKQISKLREIKTRKFLQRVVADPTTLVAKKTKTSDPSKVLTKEELYAYNQLMTALAITSNNLKLVKDKVQGVEN